MENKSLTKTILKMSYPPMLSMTLQYAYNFVDSIYIGRYDFDSLNALSLSFPLQSMVLAIGIGSGVGVNALVARYLGKGDKDYADNIVTNSLIFSGVIYAFILFMGLNIMPGFFKSFHPIQEVYDYAIIYTRIIIIFSFSSIFHICVQKILQGTGNMLAPMYFQMAGALTNLILDPILIYGLLGFSEMGIRGAAIATIIGQCVSTVLAFYVLIFRQSAIKIKIKGVKVEVKLMAEILYTGLPSFVMNVAGSIVVTFINMMLALIGQQNTIAVFGIYFKLQSLIFMSLNGHIQGIMPMMSHFYGAGKMDKLMGTFKRSLFFTISYFLLATIIIHTIPREILHIFKLSPSLTDIGVECLKVISIGYMFSSFSFIFGSLFQTSKRVGYSIIIHLMRQILLLFPIVWLLSNSFGMRGIWWAFPLTELGAGLIALLFYIRTKKYYEY